MIFKLTEDNFILFAMKHYDNPHCRGVDEFEEDLKKFKYLKRLFRKFKYGSQVNERLILNHIIVILNLFGVEAASLMLFFKIDEKYWPQLKSFLIYLNAMPPDNLFVIADEKVLQSLRNI